LLIPLLVPPYIKVSSLQSMKLIRDYVLHGEPIPLSPNTRWRALQTVTAALEVAFLVYRFLPEEENRECLFSKKTGHVCFSSGVNFCQGRAKRVHCDP
jgi:hypothetical protein